MTKKITTDRINAALAKKKRQPKPSELKPDFSALSSAIQSLADKETVVNVDVHIDTAEISNRVAQSIEIPAPVVNVERSKPSGYYVSYEYDNKGRPSGARIEPVEA